MTTAGRSLFRSLGSASRQSTMTSCSARNEAIRFPPLSVRRRGRSCGTAPPPRGFGEPRHRDEPKPDRTSRPPASHLVEGITTTKYYHYHLPPHMSDLYLQ